METFVQIVVLCVVSAVLTALLRRNTPEFSFLLSLACCALCFLAVREFLSPVLGLFEQLQALSGLDAALLSPVLKTVGVGILTQIAVGFCQDAGEQALAKMAELCGAVLALYAALPLVTLLLQTLRKMMGG